MRAAIDLIKLMFVGALLWAVAKAWFLKIDVYASYSSNSGGYSFQIARDKNYVELCDGGHLLYHDQYQRPHCETFDIEVADQDHFILTSKGGSKELAFTRVSNKVWDAKSDFFLGGRWNSRTP